MAEWHGTLFIGDEFGNRIVVLLNNFLDVLCGPKCLNLKVENPAEVNFTPNELLSDILKIYLHLSNYQEFYNLVVSD